MTQQERTNGDGDGITLALVSDRLDRLEEALWALTHELRDAREEARKARATISQALGDHHEQTHFYLGQFVSAFNLLGGKINALSHAITGHGINEARLDNIVPVKPRYAPLAELRADGSVALAAPAPPPVPTTGSPASAPRSRRASRRDRPGDS
jgi:hypothetical protein